MFQKLCKEQREAVGDPLPTRNQVLARENEREKDELEDERREDEQEVDHPNEQGKGRIDRDME